MVSQLSIRTAQTLGLTTTLLLAGSTLSLSLQAVPVLLQSPPDILLQQWASMFRRGRSAAPPLALLAGGAWFWLAWAGRHVEAGSKGVRAGASSVVNGVGAYVAAGALCVGIIPYTLLVMRSTNSKLLTAAGEGVVNGRETAHQLVDWWGVLNLGRGGILSAAGVVGLWTALS